MAKKDTTPDENAVTQPWANDTAPKAAVAEVSTQEVAIAAKAAASLDADGSVDDQAKRVEASGAVTVGTQAPLAIVNLTARGLTVDAAKAVLAGEATFADAYAYCNPVADEAE